LDGEGERSGAEGRRPDLRFRAGHPFITLNVLHDDSVDARLG
jgi:hypothetical protein